MRRPDQAFGRQAEPIEPVTVPEVIEIRRTGTVSLTRPSHKAPFPPRGSNGRGCGRPRPMGVGSDLAEGGTAHQMGLEIEDIVDGGVGGEDALGRDSGFELCRSRSRRLIARCEFSARLFSHMQQGRCRSTRPRSLAAARYKASLSVTITYAVVEGKNPLSLLETSLRPTALTAIPSPTGRRRRR